MSRSAQKWLSIKQKIENEAIRNKIVYKVENGMKVKMNYQFVLILSLCNIPRSSYSDQTLSDLKPRFMNHEDEKIVKRAWKNLSEAQWRECQQHMYAFIREIVPGKIEVKDTVSSSEVHCASLLFQKLSKLYEQDLADNGPTMQRM